LSVVDHAPVLHRSQLSVKAVKGTGAGAHQPVDAAVKGVSLALPRCAQSTGEGVHLEYLGAVAVHLGITPGGKACQAGPNDDD